MTIARWTPPVAPTRQEQFILKRLGRVRKLLGFLRLHRHELFDDAFQDELAAMYRTTGAGKEARPPAMMAMATLVQGYLGISDAEMIELTVLDLRVQMVLGCLGAEEPPVFARRVAGVSRAADRRRHGSPRARTHRRVGEARRRRSTLASCPRRCAWRSIRVRWRARDASKTRSTCWPMRRAMWCAVRPACSGGPRSRCAVRRAFPCSWSRASSARSTSTGTMPVEKTEAITTFSRQLDSLQSWIARQLPEALAQPPLKEQVETLVQIRTQDLEPDPQGGGARIREGVAADRRVSIADKEMRHGRKSKSKRFNGFKRHIAADVDRGLILACAITPANRPEDEAMPSLTVDLERQGLDVDHLLIDRGYINSTLVDEVLSRRGKIVCKPWKSHNGRLFPKSAFTLNLRDRTIACPNGQVQPITFGTTVEFDPDICDHCTRRTQCTTAELGNGRTVAIAENEALQQRLRKQIQTSAGRAALRERTTIEHKLAHISQRQGNHARYVGVRKNTFDLRRASAIQNLETLHRSEIESRKAA